MKIAFDLDGTLAHYTNEENGIFWIGEPIQPMIDKAKEHINNGDEVIIFTARLSEFLFGFTADCIICDTFNYFKLVNKIADWTEKYIGKRLNATCIKTRDIDLIYDNIAVHVENNTGRVL